MGASYDFDITKCMSRLGIDEGGRVQRAVTQDVLNLSEPYIPFAEGNLKASGHIENNTDVVWGGATAQYAHYMWGGIVYEDPQLHCAGFPLKDGGWASRKDVKKIPTNRKLQYNGAPMKGAKWVPRMLQDGGREQIQQDARRAVGK